MHSRVEAFVERVRDRHGLDPEVREFEETTESAATAAAAIGCDPGDVANSVVMVVDGDAPLSERVVVAVVPGDARVSESALAAHVGASADDVRLAAPAEVRDVVGWRVGGVPPLGHDADVAVVLDRDVLDRGRVWVGAGTESAMAAFDPRDVRDAADAAVLDLAE